MILLATVSLFLRLTSMCHCEMNWQYFILYHFKLMFGWFNKCITLVIKIKTAVQSTAVNYSSKAIKIEHIPINTSRRTYLLFLVDCVC